MRNEGKHLGDILGEWAASFTQSRWDDILDDGVASEPKDTVAPLSEEERRANAANNGWLAAQTAGGLGVVAIGQTLENGDEVTFYGDRPFTIQWKQEGD